MIVGTVVVGAVLFRAGADLLDSKAPDDSVIFHMVAGGLAVVAAIELAYTLFTPGPDEVVNPLMLGVSSVFLFQVSKIDDLTWGSGLAALLVVSSLGGLFIIRRRFVEEKDPVWRRKSDQGEGMAEVARSPANDDPTGAVEGRP